METKNFETAPTEDITFDTSSGISLEEQYDILKSINTMAGGRRFEAEAVQVTAKKKDFLFPLYVNIGAIIILGLGVLAFSFFHRHDEQVIRESSSTLGFTERILIQEIRQETDRLINIKESQINEILSRLSAADNEYRELQISIETLTEAQKERAAQLLIQQDEYRLILSELHDDRARILEDSRRQEAFLRAQAEERIQELSARLDHGQASLTAAMEELRRLGTEQELVSRAESQMSGFYIIVNEQLAGGSFDEASNTLEAMRIFLDSPSLQGISIMQTRRQTHLAAISALEEVIIEGRRLSAEPTAPARNLIQDNEIAELRARNAALERDIAALSSQGTDQIRILTEYISLINQLETENLNQQYIINQQDGEIQMLLSEMIQQERRMEELIYNISTNIAQNEELRQQNTELQNQIAAVRALLLDNN